jgi:hypothetical protein
MAKLPTPEKNAKELLSIFVFTINYRPGEVVLKQQLKSMWNGRIEDLMSGLEYAVENSWIEALANGYKLTQTGFDLASNNQETDLEGGNVNPIKTTYSKSTPKKFVTAFDIYSVTGSPLGEGGAGKVFSVHNEDNESYALKCLSPDRITTEKRKRFKNEIAFCSKFSHKNIIEVIDYGVVSIKEKDCPFYVMPMFKMTLRNLLENNLAPENVISLFSQILDGIEAAHLLKVFHRDLKPENILFDPNKELVVIADFGIAHFEEDLLETKIETKFSDRMANFAYAAPEQRVN